MINRGDQAVANGCSESCEGRQGLAITAERDGIAATEATHAPNVWSTTVAPIAAGARRAGPPTLPVHF